jgi:glycosyltransferase involved in cell wall biosynthesis
MNHPMPKICVLAATPLTIHFFLKPHLIALARHFDVTLACNPKNDAYLPPLDLPVHQAAIGMERKISPLRDLITLFELFSLFRRERFDLVVSVVPKAGLLGMLAACLAGVPRRVHIFQGEVWASRRGFMRGLLKAMDKVIAKSATHILAVSPSERQFLQEQGVVRPGQVSVLGSGSISGVDMLRFRPDPEARSSLRNEHAIPDDAVVCLFLGRLTADKGVFDLVQAFALCAKSNPRLWLVLVGPDEDGVGPLLLSTLTGEVAGRLLVEGFTHTPERYIAAADFLCLPSYREGFGMVVIEAAAAGIPSIGSRIYGVSDAIVENETGLLVPPGNAQQLAEVLARLAGDEALRERLALAGHTRVENEFRQEKVVAGYVNYFRELLNR